MVCWPWYPRPPKKHLAQKQFRDPFEMCGSAIPFVSSPTKSPERHLLKEVGGFGPIRARIHGGTIFSICSLASSAARIIPIRSGVWGCMPAIETYGVPKPPNFPQTQNKQPKTTQTQPKHPQNHPTGGVEVLFGRLRDPVGFNSGRSPPHRPPARPPNSPVNARPPPARFSPSLRTSLTYIAA